MDIIGTVSDIGSDIVGSPYLIFGRPFRGVHAVFPRSAASGLTRLSKGQSITVRCRIGGKTLGTVVARDCALQ
jgi:tRNA_anti-like